MAGELQWHDIGRGGDDPQAAMRELHHRVSNHLQILASLAGLQARSHAQPEVRDALLDMRRRILAVARVNSALQSSDDGAAVRLSSCLDRLREDLETCFSADKGLHLRLEFDIDDTEASADRALTLSLIINELVTNAVKHAVLPYGGRIWVRLHRETWGEWRLSVRDEGAGFSRDPFAVELGEHGFSMVRALAAKLRGAVSIDPRADGGVVSVTFL